MKKLINSKDVVFLLLLSTVLCMFVSFPIYADENEKSVSVMIPVYCDHDDLGYSFDYKLIYEEGAHESSQEIVSEELRLSSKETKSFEIKFIEPGNYRYTLNEVRGSDSSVVYDDKIYRIDVYVTEDDAGVLSAEPIVYEKGSSSKEAMCSFKNRNVVEPVTLKDEGTVQTGDSSNTCGVLMLALLSGFSVLLLIRRKGAMADEE